MREQLKEILKHIDMHCAASFEPVVQCKEKVIKNALSEYAKGCSFDKVVALMDTTLFGSGKNGFLVTEEGLYSSHYMKKEVPKGILKFRDLADVRDGRKKGILSLTMKDGSQREVFLSIYKDGIKELLQAVIELEKTAGTGPEPEQAAWPEAKPIAQPKQAAKPETKPEPKPVAKPEPKPVPKPEPKPAPEPAAKPEPKPIPKPEPKPAPKPVVKPEPKPAPKPEPVLNEDQLLDEAMALFKKGDQKKAFEMWLSLAEKGNASAQNCAAVCCERGEGVEADIKKAVFWYEKSAAQGLAKACNNLGRLYSAGKGVEQNDRKAAELYEQAANQGHATAQFRLFLAYYNGRGVAENSYTAVKWCRAAAEGGHVQAALELARIYKTGYGGTQKDLSEMKKWYQIAAEKGDADAMFGLALSYATGEGAALNYSEALQWAEKAKAAGCQQETDELIQALIQLIEEEKKGASAAEQAERLWKSGKREEAAGQYEAAIELGWKDIGTARRIGDYYEKEVEERGHGRTATFWYQKAADWGDAECQCLMGVRYLHGRWNWGPSRDEKKALQYFEASAQQGNTDAQYQLGVLLSGESLGMNVVSQEELRLLRAPVDKEKGHAWLIKAAAAGHEKAQKLCRDLGISPESDPKPVSKTKTREIVCREAEKLWNAGDRKTAVSKYEEALELGWTDPETARMIGDYYEFGEHKELKFPERYASPWYKRAAEWGDAECQRLMGLRCLCKMPEVWGVAWNQEKALAYLSAAAGQGNAEAQYQLGILLLGGKLGLKEIFRTKTSYTYLESCKAVGMLVKGEDWEVVNTGLDREVTEEDKKTGIIWLANVLLQNNADAQRYCKKAGLSQENICAIYSEAMKTYMLSMQRGQRLTAVFDNVPVFIAGVKDCIGQKRVWGYWKIDYIELTTGEAKQGAVCCDGKGDILYKDYESLPQSFRAYHLIRAIEPGENQADRRTIQYLYFENGQHYFMDLETYEQYEMTEERFAHLNGRGDSKEPWNIQESDIFEAYFVGEVPVFLAEKK